MWEENRALELALRFNGLVEQYENTQERQKVGWDTNQEA